MSISCWERHLAVGTTALAFLAVVPVMAAVAFASPWLVGVAVVPALLLTAEIAVPAPGPIELAVRPDHRRVVEGDDVEVRVEVRTSAPTTVLLAPLRSDAMAGAVGLVPVAVGHRPATATIRSTATRWGRATVGIAGVEWRSPLGLVRWVGRTRIEHVVWVHPRGARLRGRLGVAATTIRVGGHVSRAAGAGTEFHSRRPFQSGDRWRDVDHRRLARGEEPSTILRHAHRARDVVCVVDLVDDGRRDARRASLADHAVRVTDAVVRAHLADRDRVGAVVLADAVTTVRVADGDRHATRVLDAMLTARPRADAMAISHGLDLRRVVPAGASVLLVSPLLDRGLVDQALVLGRHGCAVAVLHVGADLFTRARLDLGRADRLAAELHDLRQATLHDRLAQRGIAVVAWRADDRLDVVAEQAMALHRRVVRRRR